MVPHSSTLAWKIPWMEKSSGLQSMGSLWVGHDQATSLSLFSFMHWRRKWQPTPVFLPGESQGQRSLVGCRLWGRTKSDMTECLSSSSSSLGITSLTTEMRPFQVLFLKSHEYEVFQSGWWEQALFLAHCKCWTPLPLVCWMVLFSVPESSLFPMFWSGLSWIFKGDLYWSLTAQHSFFLVFYEH